METYRAWIVSQHTKMATLCERTTTPLSPQRQPPQMNHLAIILRRVTTGVHKEEEKIVCRLFGHRHNDDSINLTGALSSPFWKTIRLLAGDQLFPKSDDIERNVEIFFVNFVD